MRTTPSILPEPYASIRDGAKTLARMSAQRGDDERERAALIGKFADSARRGQSVTSEHGRKVWDAVNEGMDLATAEALPIRRTAQGVREALAKQWARTEQSDDPQIRAAADQFQQVVLRNLESIR